MSVSKNIAQNRAKRGLTRCRQVLTNSIMRRAKDFELLAARDTLVECFSNLEKAHNKFLTAAEIHLDLEENAKEVGYLNLPHLEVADL